MKSLLATYTSRALTFLLVLSFSLLVSAEYKTHFLVKTFNLEEMVSAADRIFVGRLIRTKEGFIDARGGTIPITIYTFAVEEPIKGVRGKNLTIRQVGHRSDPSSVFGHSAPHYREGETLMIFLARDSDIGLTSPVGLGQGVFHVKKERGVKLSVVNDRKNAGLLEGSPRVEQALRGWSSEARRQLKPSDGEMPYANFRDLVLELLNQ